MQCGRCAPWRTVSQSREMEIVKKLSLKIEELEISTFETARVETKTGTVEAFLGTKIHQYTCDPAVGTCFGYTCIGACY